MRKGISWVLAALVALAGGAAAAEEFRWEGALGAGQTLEIKGVNGSIEATAGDAVLVTAEKRARRSDPDTVRIEVVEHAGGVTICAVYPGEDNRCAPGEGGKMSTRDNDVSVDFSVRVPAGVRLVGRTVNGGIAASGLQSEAALYTVNGGVQLETSGFGQAETVNGSIKATLGRGDWTGDLELRTVNGSITLALPDGVGAEVSARTVNGGIETDFPLTVKGRFGGRRVDGRIGGGGRGLELETVNGSIRLRKAS